MFCSNCGAQVADNASFCSNCGNRIVQNAFQQPNVYQQPNEYQQPNAYQQPIVQEAYEEKFGINLVYPDGHNEIGDVYFSATRMKFVKKSKAVRLAFGFLGSALETGEEKLHLNLADVVSGGRTRIGVNVYVYQLTFRNGEIYKLCVNNPAKMSYLEKRFG